MKSELVLRSEAMGFLIEKFGIVGAERFINSIKREKFDYTEWRRDLLKDKSVNEIYNMAVEFQKNIE
ncbi:hypothetical protein [Methanobrevibacter filiformis]|uniref:Uncharacterized protein n=1 Tax=Methanobrevibacter filiformis TaxID=55758 RepID=A0A166AJ85_9EURY|nr:hypothetical protein [Methanobrevibacter filiformis]KZX12098.1 hypothetical protein MBFIL_12280 [Methanobrevibacter filiformis]